MLIQSKLFKSIFEILGAVTGLTALCIQLYITVSSSPEAGISYPGGIIRYLSFMTIWTNIVVAAYYIFSLRKKNTILTLFFSKPIVQTGILVYISIVGLVYHFVLSGIWNPKGVSLFADILLHYVVPLFYFFYWVLFVKKGEQKFINSLKWLTYPLIYIIYVMIRGAIGHQYPYYFLEPALGTDVVLKNIFFIMAGYVLVGIVIVLLDKFFSTFINEEFETEN